MALPSASMPSRARVRARLVADVRDAALAVDARFGPAVRGADEAIRGLAPMAWVNAQPYIAMHDAILALGGAQQLLTVSRRSVKVTATGPLLSKLATLGQKVLSRHPGALLRWLPAARAMILRDLGEMSVRFVVGGAEVDLSGTALLASESYRVAHQGIIAGVLDDAGCDGSVNPLTLQAGASPAKVTFAVRWWPRAARPSPDASTS